MNDLAGPAPKDGAHTGGISERDRAILEFEFAHPRHYAAKQNDIRLAFGLTEARYYQMVNRLVKRPDVVAEFPQLASRVLRKNAAAERRYQARRLQHGE